MPEAVPGTFTQIPASIAFSTLYLRVQNYVMAPSDADVVVVAKEAINEAIDRLNTRNWYWARTIQAITMVAGTQEYALTGNFRAPRAAQLLGTTGEVIDELEYMDAKELDDQFPSRFGQGGPTHYTVFNEFDNAKMTLSITPNAAWVATYPTLRLRYFRRLPKLSADADLFAGPSEAESFLVWYGRSTIAAHWSPEQMGFADRRAKELWDLLIRDNTNRDTTDY